MSNPSTPFGFYGIGLVDGIAPNFGDYPAQILTSNGHSIYGGDVASVISAGYFDYAAAVGSGAPIGGVFDSYFSWPSISAGMTVRTRSWLGQTADIVAGGVLTCKIQLNPQAKFIVRTNGAGGVVLTQANVGYGINFARGSTPGNNQISSYAADVSDMSSTPGAYPFKITAVYPTGPTAQGVNDITSTYQLIEVMFNNLTNA